MARLILNQKAKNFWYAAPTSMWVFWCLALMTDITVEFAATAIECQNSKRHLDQIIS